MGWSVMKASSLFGSWEPLSPGLEGCSEPLSHCKGGRRAAWQKGEVKAVSQNHRITE